jgi:hypothetical protein
MSNQQSGFGVLLRLQNASKLKFGGIMMPVEVVDDSISPIVKMY